MKLIGSIVFFVVAGFLSFNTVIAENSTLPITSGWVDCNSKPVPFPEDAFIVSSVGDLTFSGHEASNKGAMSPFALIFKQSDFNFANLEGVITDRLVPTKPYIPGKSYPFRFPASTARLLAQLPIHAVSIANNHSNDYGPEGISDAYRYLGAFNIVATGNKGEYASITRGGKKIALVAFSPYLRHNNINDIESAKTLVRSAKINNDLVIVTFHGGAEGERNITKTGTNERYFGEERGNVRLFSHSVVLAGADLVVGHGPHVIRPMECHNMKLAAYSLGNFVSAGGLNTRGVTGVSMLLQVALHWETGDTVALRIVPARFSKKRLPILDKSGRAVFLNNWLADKLRIDVAESSPILLSGFEEYSDRFRKWFAKTKLYACHQIKQSDKKSKQRAKDC